MSGKRAPFVVVCIDGTDAINMARTVHALLDIPAVGRTLPTQSAAVHMYMMLELQRTFDFLPALVVAPSLVTSVAVNDRPFSSIDWQRFYPMDKTLFITLQENIEAEMKTEGTRVFAPIHRFGKRQRFIDVSRELGKRGYRTKCIDDMGSAMDIAHKVLDEIRLTQRNIIEIAEGRRNHE
jgi:hypothetical protein